MTLTTLDILAAMSAGQREVLAAIHEGVGDHWATLSDWPSHTPSEEAVHARSACTYSMTIRSLARDDSQLRINGTRLLETFLLRDSEE